MQKINPQVDLWVKWLLNSSLDAENVVFHSSPFPLEHYPLVLTQYNIIISDCKSNNQQKSIEIASSPDCPLPDCPFS
jgi:hypothetical protein